MIQISDWPSNLYFDIVGKPVQGCVPEVPDDFTGSMLYVLHTFLSREDQNIVLAHYQDHIPVKDIAEETGITRENVRVILGRIIRKLRTPKCAKYIVHGVQNTITSTFERVRQEGYDIGYHDGYQVCKAEYELRDEEELARWDRIRKTFPQFVNMLEIGFRAKNALRSAGIEEVDVLLSLTEHQLKSVPGIGEKTASEIIQYFEEKGFSMKPECLPAGLKWEGVTR